MKKGQNKNNGVKNSATNVIENILNHSVLQPTLDHLTASQIFDLKEKKNIQFSKGEKVVKVQPPKQIETVIITEDQYQQFQKFGIATDVKSGQKLDKATFDIYTQDLRKAIHVATIEKARKGSTSIKIIQYNQSWLETFNREFIVSQIEQDNGIGFFERYYTNTLSKEELNSINFKMFKNNAVVRIECSILATKLKSETCYVKLEDGFIHLFTNKRETRIPYKRINLVKYKTFEYFLLNYKLQVDNSDLIYKRSELSKFQKELASNLATKIITSGTEGIYVTQTKFANKVVSSIKKKQKEANVITENPTEAQVIQA